MRPLGNHLVAAVILFAPAAPIDGRAHDRFGYKFVMTPEEGPVDPAIEKRYSAAFDACQQRAVTTLANSACFNDEFARQDVVLNRTWRLTVARIGPKARTTLVAAQRRWIAGRDPFCRSQAADYRGGTIAPVIYASCRVEQTIRRTIWLARPQGAASGGSR